ncbi:GNAT family N-acetyltransferase [Hymenobacter sp. UYCo722]|uniref:GNAT family N-acetyltransferase n=1 Tax=Hymenobacter sp. UYCo722 TaxID=3156335 RepID=UPI00339B98D8
MNVAIASISAAEARALLPQLHQLLQDAVDSGASVGFLPPLSAAEAQEYWQSVVAAIEAGHRVLLVAHEPGAAGQLLGTVQLDLATRPNSLLRAEVSKLLVHTRARRQGLARQLLVALETQAAHLGRSTLVLDTRHGDGAELLYQNMGYQFVGAIPAYFINYDGQPHATAVYYKLLIDKGEE